MGIHGAANNLAANTTEFFYSVAESNDLGGTHKCEVQGVEEEDHILPWRTHKHLSSCRHHNHSQAKFKRESRDTFACGRTGMSRGKF